MRPHEVEGHSRAFKGVWLCAAIYESQELSPVEKLLLAEIDALTTDANACYASNAHFSNRLGITITRVDHLLGKLTRLGYIVRVSFDGRVTRRVLAPEFSSNPSHSIALMRNAQRQIRSVKNNRAALSETTEQDCDNRQSGTVKNSKATYIKKIPKENTISKRRRHVIQIRKFKLEVVTKQQKSCRRIAFLMETSSPNLRAIRQPQIQRLWSISWFENTDLAKSSGKQWTSTAHRWVMRMSGGKSRSSNPSRVATLPELYWPHCAMTGSLRSNSKPTRRMR